MRPILKAALVVHIIQDTGQHRGELNDILGWTVIQTQAPPTAEKKKKKERIT